MRAIIRSMFQWNLLIGVCVFLSALQACSRRFTKKLYKSILEWGPFAPNIAIQPTID